MTRKQTFAAGRPPLAERLFDLLEGGWTIEREIRPKGRFSGTARFSRVDARTLAYVEEGILAMGDGREMPGERRYTYRLHEDRIKVIFVGGVNDGKTFVDLPFPSDAEARWPFRSGDTHLCLKDTYQAMFCFENIDEFDVTYTVCGPAKDYVSRSVHRRIKVTA